MKAKLLLAGILMACTFTSQAQKNIPKGSWLLGGDLSFSTNKYKDINNLESKSTGFSIAPSVAVGVKDNLFVGLTVGYTFYRNSPNFITSPYDSTTIRGYNAGVFLRKYKPLKSNFYLFLQGGLGGSFTRRRVEDVPNRDFLQKDVMVNLSISPGISYAINSKLQVETGFNNLLGVNYSRTEITDNAYYIGKRTNTGFNAYTTLDNFNSQLYIGFRLLLQKKDKGTVSKAG